MSSTAVFSLWIINKAGGLIYQRNYSDGLSPLSANEYLVLAGTFHGIHAITGRIGPKIPNAPQGGVEIIEAESFKMCCLQSATGTKFVLLTTPSHPNPHAVLKKVYEAYAEHLKDPFYKSEMPIVRAEVFDEKIKALVSGQADAKK
ncbi:Sybindin-like protein [Atractiella rhizophila]|nr:Sybindin-like protein [Atractiella rhizophila]